MAKKKTAKPSNKNKSTTLKKGISNQQRLVFGSFLCIVGILLIISFVSYFFTGTVDQSVLSEFTNKDVVAENWMSKIGAWLSHLFLVQGFGISAFIFAFLFILSGVYVMFNLNKNKLFNHWIWGTLNALWLSVCLGFFTDNIDILGGVMGYEVNQYLQIYMGKIGVILLLVFISIIYMAVRFKITAKDLFGWLKSSSKKIADDFNINESQDPDSNGSFQGIDNGLSEETEAIKSAFELNVERQEPTIKNYSGIDRMDDKELTLSDTNDLDSTQSELNAPNKSQNETSKESEMPLEIENSDQPETKQKDDLTIEIEAPLTEKEVLKNKSDKLVEDFGQFDPTLELSKFQFPEIQLLKQYQSEGITIDKEELERNKNKIVETLSNYKIGIASIKATIGPTVTLYEIVPDAGIRISKIKNLEDDIALSLSALGIRIIAPIPGKGTIGIEVPNNNPTIVSMHSVIASKKFQDSKMELPVALGKTISNETMVVDLSKMPHLLMAGATGQGKSVGLNAVLTSLLYKKHPAEVKFVLVDPKKVELTLFNKIERHYLAKLPDSEEAIITDNNKVINTLNSLCIEMDNRYEMLKNAMCRNIKEYNKKFKERKLNPNDGHQFLPYIVLVVDEFADLIMTAGKEVETPIARLAQLARAIGIHLIIATQRPSVNVITGIIKANFPARIAFRVTSKIDSRTILDGPGADQLIGRGDMLYTQGNDITRIQCAFVDTPEVEAITEFIGGQKAYPEAYILPEYIGEESGTNLDIDIADRDKLFKEAAEVIVTAQQGSASLLQRKLKLGYNRAGRLIDQLEAAGIVGPFEGSKPRQVLITDLIALEQLLENEN